MGTNGNSMFTQSSNPSLFVEVRDAFCQPCADHREGENVADERRAVVGGEDDVGGVRDGGADESEPEEAVVQVVDEEHGCLLAVPPRLRLNRLATGTVQ